MDEQIPPEQFQQKLFSEHPEIRNANESLNPISRAICFAQNYLPEKRFIQHRDLFELIAQHFHILGFTKTLKQFFEEAENEEISLNIQNISQLHFIIQRQFIK
jgi:hypothetical protein